jgi:hypothetical protein
MLAIFTWTSGLVISMVVSTVGRHEALFELWLE